MRLVSIVIFSPILFVFLRFRDQIASVEVGRCVEGPQRSLAFGGLQIDIMKLCT
jgi:hypothetical protein